MVKKIKDAGRDSTDYTFFLLSKIVQLIESRLVGVITAVKLVFLSYDSKAIQELYGTRER